jgi:hypothetical protein
MFGKKLKLLLQLPVLIKTNDRSQWPRGLRHELSSPDQTGVVVSNLTRGINVCVHLLYVYDVLSVGRGLETG